MDFSDKEKAVTVSEMQTVRLARAEEESEMNQPQAGHFEVRTIPCHCNDTRCSQCYGTGQRAVYTLTDEEYRRALKVVEDGERRVLEAKKKAEANDGV